MSVSPPAGPPESQDQQRPNDPPGAGLLEEGVGGAIEASGLVDGALVAAIYQPSELPVSSLLVNIGAQMTDTLASTGALTEALMLGCPECRAELEAYNVQTLGSWAMPSYSLLCREPVQSLADAQGLRIRSSGHMVTLAQAIGATPINLTITETFEALQRNQADCTFGSIVCGTAIMLLPSDDDPPPPRGGKKAKIRIGKAAPARVVAGRQG